MGERDFKLVDFTVDGASQQK